MPEAARVGLRSSPNSAAIAERHKGPSGFVLESEDGRVVGVDHNSAERNGKRLDVLCCIVFELVDGRIMIGREHFFDLYAKDKFWS